MKRFILRYKLLFILFLVILLLSSNFVMFNMVDKIDSATGGKFHLGYVRNHIVKFYESFNPFVGKLALDKCDLPTFDIELNQKAVNKLNDMYKNYGSTADFFRGIPYADDRFKIWQKCNLKFDKEKFKAKITFHGTDSIHFRNDKKSFAVKLNKEKLLNHIRKFALIIQEEASVPTIFSYKLQEWLTGFKVNSFLVKLKINGTDQGVYTLEEKLGKTLLEKNGLSGVDIIRVRSDWSSQYPVHNMAIDWNLANLEVKNFSKREIGALNVFDTVFNQCKDYECIKNYIDLEKMVKEEALRVLFGGGPIDGNNLKLLYNIATGRVWIYFRSENELTNISYFFDKYLYEANTRYKNWLIYYLGQDEEFRAKRDKILWRFVTHKDEIIKMFDDIYEKNIGPILADSNHYTNGRFIRYTILEKRDNLIANLNTLKKYLEYGRSYTYVKFIAPNKMELVVSADSNAPLKIDYIKFNFKGNDRIKVTSLDDNKTVTTTFNELNKYFEDKRFMMGFDKNYDLVEHRHKFIIEFDKKSQVSGFKVEFINDVTGQKIPKYHSLTKFIPYTPFIDSIGDLVLNGNYEINETLAVDDLLIKAGTKIKLAPKVSILAKKLSILGSKEKPVIIQNLVKGKPFGVVAANGDGKDEIVIKYLELSGGKDATLNGSYFSGGLSLYNHKRVMIENSFIHHNSADDGLNIKNSEILLKNNIFNANMADQVDLDFCKGFVENNRFIKHSIIKDFSMVEIPVDDNGDGLDLSGSKVVIRKNKFMGFLDKGNSIGEETQVIVIDNIYINNRSAITAKDSSKVYIANNRYENNKYNIELYQKKQIFDYPSVFNIDEKHRMDKIRNINSHFFVLIEDLNITNLESLESFEQLKNRRWKEL